MRICRHYNQGVAAVVFLVALLFFLRLPTAKANARSSWQNAWDAALAAAERKGQVNIAGPPGESFREAMVAGFTKAHPKIKVEILGGSGGDKVSRILRERQVGLYEWDL